MVSGSSGATTALSNPSGLGGPTGLQGRVECQELERLVGHYIQAALAPRTQLTYSSAYRRYMQFCSSHHYTPFPLCEPVLCQYAVFLAGGKLKAQSIKSYLSAVRYYQILNGFTDPFASGMYRLEYVLKGIKAEQARSGAARHRTRLPVTPHILRKIREVLEAESGKADNIMLWAAVCTCFFGFLRSGEICVASWESYDPGAHLSFGDVTLDSRDSPTVAQVTIKASKTDPFRHGVTLFLGRTHNNLCPVTALAAYLASRDDSPGPFFKLATGCPLSREVFVSMVRRALSAAGFDASLYAGHSFRSGAATTAAACGLEDSLIKTLGRWNSAAYQLYIQIPREQLAGLSARLAV